MGKHECYLAIEFYGGKATLKQIKQFLTKNYPESPYVDIASEHMKRLTKDRTVSYNKRTKQYTIRTKLERNVVILDAALLEKLQ